MNIVVDNSAPIEKNIHAVNSRESSTLFGFADDTVSIELSSFRASFSSNSREIEAHSGRNTKNALS